MGRRRSATSRACEGCAHDQFTFQRPETKHRALRSARVGKRTYYAAVGTIREDRPRQVYAAACLVKYNPCDRDGHIFGYKDMHEQMGPCEAACPAAGDLITPTDNAHALGWRVRCCRALATRAAEPKLRDGVTVVFASSLTFTDGRSFERMTVVIDPRRPRTITFRAREGSARYCVSGLRTLDRFPDAAVVRAHLKAFDDELTPDLGIVEG